MTRRMLDARLCPPVSMGAALAAALLALGSAQAQTPPARLDDPSAPLREAARTEKRVDLITLYREALQNDAQFQAARFQAQATAEREPQARAALLPSLNASGDFFVRRYDGTNPTVGNTYGDYGAGLSLLVPVYRPQSWETLEQSRLQVLQGENSLAQARQDLAVRLANAYFNVLAARDQVNSLEVQKEAATNCAPSSAATPRCWPGWPTRPGCSCPSPTKPPCGSRPPRTATSGCATRAPRWKSHGARCSVRATATSPPWTWWPTTASAASTAPS